MFIIVGNDIKNRQVMIHDTADHTTVPASYEMVKKVVRKEYKINGLDTQGNIICNEIDVFDELKVQLRPILAKTILLQLDEVRVLELIFPLCKKYGIVEKPFDLAVNTQTYTITFYLLGVVWHYKEDKIKQFPSITHIKEFEQLPIETRYMLQELYKIPLRPTFIDLEIIEIGITKYDSYYIKFKCGVYLHVFINAYEFYYPTIPALIFKPQSTFFEYYLRHLAEEKPQGPYFIRRLDIEFHYTFDLKEIIYTR